MGTDNGRGLTVGVEEGWSRREQWEKRQNNCNWTTIKKYRTLKYRLHVSEEYNYKNLVKGTKAKIESWFLSLLSPQSHLVSISSNNLEKVCNANICLIPSDPDLLFQPTHTSFNYLIYYYFPRIVIGNHM